MRIAVLLKDNTKIQKISCLLSWYYPDRCHSNGEIQGDHVVPSERGSGTWWKPQEALPSKPRHWREAGKKSGQHLKSSAHPICRAL
jgi:hypothetical protein